MKNHVLSFASRKAGPALALSLGLALAGCGGIATNRTLYSTHEPVVEQVNYTLDVQAGADGLAYGEGRRLNGWLDALGLKYGDRISVDDPSGNPAVHDAIAAIAGRYGLLLGEKAPQTAGYIQSGSVRVVITRAKASVPGCPDWSAKSDFNPNNATSPNFGCATNSNLAAMVANPQDLVHGNDSGDNTVVTSDRAIKAWREAEPTGAKGLTTVSSKGN